MAFKSFEELDVWKLAREFRNEIFALCKHFPAEEKYRLTDQIVRSSRSIGANIAEGHGRFHYQENIQFCRHARGSLSETKEHLICAFDCKYLSEDQLKYYIEKYDLILLKINGYISYLKSQKNLTNPPTSQPINQLTNQP